MKQRKDDRRSRRTYDLVSDAFIELLLEKPYDAILVQDILDRAGIGRTTFYAHYFDKKDALERTVEQILNTFQQQIVHRDVGQELVPAAALFAHVQQHRQVFQALFRHGGRALWETGHALVKTVIEDVLTSTLLARNAASIPPAAIAHYLAGAFFNLLEWWLEAERPCSSEQMADIFEQLAMPGVQIRIRGGKVL